MKIRASHSNPHIVYGRSLRWLAVAGIVCIVLAALHPYSFVLTLFPDARAKGLMQTNSQQEAITLELNKPIERELAGWQKHYYEITLTEGQFVSLEIKLRGIDPTVSLQAPNEKPYVVFETLGLSQYQGFINHVAASPGIHRFTVSARSKAPVGHYELRLAALRVANENDRSLQQARDLVRESIQLTREGRGAEARPLLTRVLEIREKVWGPDSYNLLQALSMLGGNFEVAGDYANAEQLRLRSVKIAEKTRGLDHPEVARHLVQLGGLYQKKGDDIKAEQAYQRTLKILEEAQLSETHNFSSVLNALGNIYYAKGDYENADNYYQRARVLWEKLLGPDDFHLEPTLIALGRVAYDAGDYDKAKLMFERALALREKALGNSGAGVLSRLNDLGMLYVTTGEYEKAEALYQRALTIYEKTGRTDFNVQETLYGLARLHGAQGKTAAAVKFEAQASELEERQVELNLAVGSEREKNAFLSNFALRASRNVSLHTNLAPADPAAQDVALTTILRRKGRVQDAFSESLSGLRRRATVEDQALFDELNQTLSSLARLHLNEPQNISPHERQSKLKALEEQRERTEAEISRRSAGFYQRTPPITLAAVQSVIPGDAALVEFALYHPFNPKAPDNEKAYGDPHYVAYVVRHQGEVQWTELGDAKAIEDAVSAFRKALRSPAQTQVRRVARALDEKVMKRVRSLVGDARHLLLSPDGELTLIPFAALIDERGRYLVERYAINYLTSGRDLLRLRTERESKSASVVVADPAFGNPAVLTSGTNGPLGRLASSARFDYSHFFFGPLPGITDEVQELKRLLPEAKFFTREEATEANLKRVRGPKILHVATHGFFMENDSASENTAPDKRRLGKPLARAYNPLLRSGLALAGANQGRSGDEDGLLTALEATALDLWGTKLVVLSACDTGVGEVKNGEGVYGLRRALFLAGTESQLMSLWPVSDRSTRELMTGYYRALVQDVGRGEALRHVQLQMLSNKPRSHPYYWASFILAGEWANLEGQR